MKNAGIFAHAALPLLLTSCCGNPTVAADQSSSNALPLHPRFRSHLKCPYADRWLAKGPKQAALELGLDERGRKLQSSLQQQPVRGSCSYDNAFSGGITCMQFQGAGWIDADMRARCATESGGAFVAEGCAGDAAGWCDRAIADGKHEATAMMLSAMADCDGSKMACETFMGGAFVADGACATESQHAATGESPYGGGSPSRPGAASSGDDSAMKCLLAPGAIGAAHQAGFSKGYSRSCPDTPARESPYMWPLRWSADAENQAMAYGSDEVLFKSRGRTFYMLDRNWKRSDTTFQEGLLRTIGQGPCDDVDEDFAEEGFLGCRKNQTDGTMSTMIHRENLMYFISWKNDETNPVQPGETDATKIEECNMMNLAIIGNIRPDWFMDKRGDDTDVQYLGDQHVYYADGDTPKLVKQWRKKDFASQYFVMSMMNNPPNKLEQKPEAPIEDNMHWPLILNIPGEGFGDDSLQVYRNHKLLTDEDEDLFKLIENYEASGGTCTDLRAMSESGGDFGPPVQDEDEAIPSNLKVDPLSWVSNEITFSPIWEIPTKEVMASQPTMSDPSTNNGKSKMEVSRQVTVESCYDESTSSMDMSIHFHDIEPTSDGLLPWMAIGYRPSELCAMTPPEGGVTPVIMVTQTSEGDVPEAQKTQLLPGAKSMSTVAFDSMNTLMRPLRAVDEYTNVSVDAPMVSSAIQIARSSFAAENTVSLHFKQTVGEMPSVMNLMYAIGMTSQLGIHTTRGCFQVKAMPCGGAESEGVLDRESISIDLGAEQNVNGVDVAPVKSSANIVPAGAMFLLLATFAVMFGL